MKALQTRPGFPPGQPPVLSLRQRGQALVFSLFASILMILALFAMFSLGEQSIEKMRLQNTADAAAYSAAVAEARDYNFSAYTNRAMVANQVAVAQFVGLTSWFRNMSAFANGDTSNAGRDVYQIFLELGSTPVANIYKKFLKAFGKVTGIFDEGRGGSTFMGFAVTVLDGLIKVYSETQKYYHYGTALTVAETLGAGFAELGDAMKNLTGADWFTALDALDGGDNVVKLNDPDARLTTFGGFPYLIYHIYKWYNFTEGKDPNTDGADGPDADRFAKVTVDSLDDFSRDRSTKPAWGFYFFYAPPLTYIDPTRFIPQPWSFGPLFLPVIHRGGTELKVTDANGNSTGSTTSTSGDTGVDCHGNAVQAQTDPAGSSGISVSQWSQLGAYSGTACEGDSGLVTVGDTTHPKGVYAYNGTTWIDPATLQNKTSTDPGKKTTSGASGNTGAANSKSKKTWTAMDASSWSGLHIFWFVIPVIFVPIPIPIPFAPPWIPLSHGAAQSGKELSAPTVLSSDNNFGTDPGQAYGEALSSWTTKISAEMRQSKGAGKTLEKVKSLGGLTTYRDVKDTDKGTDNLVGPPLVVEIEKDTDKMAQSPGSDRFALTNGAPQGKMRALSKSEVYFSRPTNDAVLTWFQRTTGTATQAEQGSLYSPYWQPRLAANNFLEQYISMEVHRAGL